MYYLITLLRIIEIGKNIRSKLPTIIEINRDLKVPTLAEFCVKKQYFDVVVQMMAEQTLASGSLPITLLFQQLCRRFHFISNFGNSSYYL